MITISELKSKPGDSIEANLNETHQFEKSEGPDGDVGDDFLPHILESSLATSTETSEEDNYSLTSNVALSTMDCSLSKENSVPHPLVSFEEFGGDFWTQPFLLQDTFTAEMSSECIALLIPNFDEIGMYRYKLIVPHEKEHSAHNNKGIDLSII
ncbi:hypothetical protein CR513_60837, partial [Mucuna pruriens]